MIIDDALVRATNAYQTGQTQKATEYLETLLASDAENARGLYLLGKIALENNRASDGIRYLTKACEVTPEWLEPWRSLALHFTSVMQIKQADEVLARAAPTHMHTCAFHELAYVVLMAANAPKAAQIAIETALGSQGPTGTAYITYANHLRKIGELNGSYSAYQQASMFSETSSLAYANLAAMQFAAGRYEDALNSYSQVTANELTETSWRLTRAELLKTLSRFEEWSDAIAQMPASLKATVSGHLACLDVAHFTGDFQEVNAGVKLIESIVRDAGSDELDELRFVYLYYDVPTQTRIAIHKPIDRVETQSRGEANRTTVPMRSLNIGYLSADFRDHVMGRMTFPMISYRNRKLHRAILYSTAPKEDAYTGQLASASDAFVRCSAASDDAIAQRIAADKIDILIDLSGPTAGSRPGVLARKPAPVIITHVGAAGPIGLCAVDYKLTDSICDLPENQEYLIEKLLPMDGCCYPVPKYPLPTQGLTKADLQRDGKVVIGAFYTYMKLSERCVKLWKRVLDEIPNGVLLFSPLDPKLKVAYENIMRAAEIPAAQFGFIPAGPTEAERLARYRVVDFVLDSMPYGGVNGTLEALYMGVPVITLTGKHHSERTSTSMLTHLGVTDTIAQTPEEYIAHAKRLATDPAWREDLSSRIRARWPKFADPTDYARRWEALLRKVAR
jgi:protein O-GlcNAc transferase